VPGGGEGPADEELDAAADDGDEPTGGETPGDEDDGRGHHGQAGPEGTVTESLLQVQGEEVEHGGHDRSHAEHDQVPDLQTAQAERGEGNERAGAGRLDDHEAGHEDRGHDKGGHDR
jgi:hypothetical protein